MFNEYWGLRHSPFDSSRDTDAFYPSRTHDEALARMAFLVEQGRRIGTLSGPAGAGKSYVLGLFARQMQRRGARAALLSVSGVPAAGIAWELADRLGVSGEGGADDPRLWRRLREHLQENTSQRIYTLVLFDDADCEDSACEATLQRLAQLDTARRSDFTLIAAVGACNGPLGDWLADATDLWVPLQPLDFEETAGYVAHRWNHAGGHQHPFHDAALRRLHQLCGGIPRRINQLCDLALVAAMSEGLQEVRPELLDSVRAQLCAPRELDTVHEESPNDALSCVA